LLWQRQVNTAVVFAVEATDKDAEVEKSVKDINANKIKTFHFLSSSRDKILSYDPGSFGRVWSKKLNWGPKA
jgi:hypothetical protein